MGPQAFLKEFFFLIILQNLRRIFTHMNFMHVLDVVLHIMGSPLCTAIVLLLWSLPTFKICIQKHVIQH